MDQPAKAVRPWHPGGMSRLVGPVSFGARRAPRSGRFATRRASADSAVRCSGPPCGPTTSTKFPFRAA